MEGKEKRRREKALLVLMFLLDSNHHGVLHQGQKDACKPKNQNTNQSKEKVLKMAALT